MGNVPDWTAGTRYLGRDADGKNIYVSAEPGGALEAMADKNDVLSAHALSVLVRAVLDAETATSEELAAFAPQLTEALEKVVSVASRLL